MFLTIIALIILASGLTGALVQIQIEKSQLKKKLRKYDTLTTKEDYEQQLDANIILKQDEVANLENQKEALNNEIKNIQKKIAVLESNHYLLSVDPYEFQYDFIASDDYLIQLNKIKTDQEQMKKKNLAYFCTADWSLQDSKKKGKNMTQDILKLMEISFEQECKSAIKEVNHQNIKRLEQKIEISFKKINNLAATINCKISEKYLILKKRELYLKYEFEQKKQEEQQRAQERRQQINQEKKERDESEKARREADEAKQRQIRHQQELEKVRQEIEKAEVEKRQQLELKVQELEQKINKDRSDEEKAILRLNRVKSGNIYVISNIGSLGADIYRICMTRAKDTEKYVTEMNPYVPFPFDIHLEIFSEDVSEDIKLLHQRFQDRRVNLVNERREFFKVSFDEIFDAVQDIKQARNLVIDNEKIGKLPQACEFYHTIAKRKNKDQPNNISL